MSALPHWDKDRAGICRRIAPRAGSGERALLTLVLKTKNESAHIGRWIAHHAEIVGLENIVVMDNESTEPPVLETYRDLAPALLAFAFHGYFDLVHSQRFFPELYAALEQRTRFMLFLDTDEYLTFVTDCGRVGDGRELVHFLEAHADRSLFPCASFTNKLGYDARFAVGAESSAIGQAVAWGKPILSATTIAALREVDIILHNAQIPRRFYEPPVFTNLVILHRSQVSAGQRLQSNARKLAAFGDIDGERAALAVAPDTLTIGREYAREMQLLSRDDRARTDESAGYVEIHAGGQLAFDSVEAEQTFAHYLRGELTAIDDMPPFPSFPRLTPMTLLHPAATGDATAVLMIDAAVIYGRHMIVYGWAFSALPDARIDVAYADRRVGSTIANGPRPDVASAYRRPAAERQGFALAWLLTAAELALHDHAITACLISKTAGLLISSARSFRSP